MTEFNNVNVTGFSYPSASDDHTLVTEKSIENIRHLHFKTAVASGNKQYSALFVNPKNASFRLDDGVSIAFDLGATNYYTNANDHSGIISFAFYNEEIGAVPDPVSLVPDDISDCTYTPGTVCGIAEKLFSSNTTNGFVITFIHDTECEYTAPAVGRYQLVYKRRSHDLLLPEGIVDTYETPICYEDAIPASIDLAFPACLSVSKVNNVVKIYLNGTWLTEFYVGGSGTSESNFGKEMYMSVYSVGNKTSASELNLYSVNGIGASDYFGDHGELLRKLNKYTSLSKLTAAVVDEVGSMLDAFDEISDTEPYMLNEVMLMKLRAWYDANKEVN